MAILTAPTREVLTQQAGIAEAAAMLPRQRYSPEMLGKMKQAADLFEAACGGRLSDRGRFQEALARDDFSYIFSAVLDRELMERYPGVEKVWPKFAARAVVANFRPKKWVDLLGGRARLTQVPELTEYPMRSKTDTEYSLTVAKFGDRFGISWESMVDDDLGALRSLPDDLAISAGETEDYLATDLLVDPTGPSAAFFTVGNGNLMAGNPALTTASLSTALTAISSRRDSDNRPLMVRAYVLMVPPALEVAANMIVNALTIRVTQGSNELEVKNWLAEKVTVVANDWIPTIDVSANVGTTWYLLPAPASRRPAAVMGFLRGHETPDLRMKADTGTRVGGGMVPADEGSFDVDDIQYRVRHVTGGTTLDALATLASNGSGS